MTVTAVHKDPVALTMILTAEFDASPERVWQLWADPRQLERWWGPPTYPATFTAHDLKPGSRVEYHMTGPSGDQPHGFWDVVEADPPRRLVYIDGFAHEDGTPDDDLPAERRAGDDRADRCRPDADVDPEHASPAPRRWSRSWPWAWRRASSRPSARSMPSLPRTRPPTDDDREHAR